VTLGEEVIEVRSRPLAVNVSRPILDTLVSALETADPASTRLRPTADLPLTVSINRLALSRRDPDLAAAALDADVEGGPLVLVSGESTLRFDTLRLHASSSRLAERLDLALTGSVDAADPSTPAGAAAGFELRGSLENLATPEGTLTLRSAHEQMTVTVDDLPTAIADGLVGSQGLLAAALGDTMTGTVEWAGFSKPAGRLDAGVSTTHGRVEVHLEAGDSGAVTPPDRPIRFELTATPALCEGLLASIHPALGDIRSAEQPIRATIANAHLPWKGDLRELDADVRIVIGPVEFSARSGVLAPLALFQQVLNLIPGSGTETPTVSGSVAPIEARIRNGVVTYQAFVIDVGEHRLQYAGSVDLTDRTLDIQTEVPVTALGVVAGQIGLPTGIKVPVRSHGGFDDIRTDVQLTGLIGNIPASILEKLIPKGR
jgi:hypothetical protein